MQYLDQYQSSSRGKIVRILVAKVDLPLGTALSKENIELVDWPADQIPKGAYSNLEELQGRMVLSIMFSGEPITSRRLATSEAGTGLAAVLPPGYLAVSVRVDDVVGVAGFIHPGDHVDVIVTMRPERTSEHMSKFILNNIRVLAVGKQLDRDKGSKAGRPISATVATLMVEPEQAEKLALAAAQGKLLLALRSSLDEEVIETKGVAPTLLLTDYRKQQRRRQVYRNPVEASEETKETDTVEIMRGDSLEKRTFEKQ